MRGGQARGPITPSIKSFVQHSLGRRSRLEEIAGDASTRSFYRVSTGKKSAVLMVHSEPLTSASPLFSNHRVLESIGAPVPRIMDSDLAHGLVLVEDFGDLTLQNHLLDTRGSMRNREAIVLYRQACDGGVAQACYSVALAYREGAGVKRSAREADKVLRHACTLERDEGECRDID